MNCTVRCVLLAVVMAALPQTIISLFIPAGGWLAQMGIDLSVLFFTSSVMGIIRTIIPSAREREKLHIHWFLSTSVVSATALSAAALSSDHIVQSKGLMWMIYASSVHRPHPRLISGYQEHYEMSYKNLLRNFLSLPSGACPARVALRCGKV